jgi:hypothetical protein
VVDPYRKAHKAIRSVLGRLLESAGRTDFGDPESIELFRAELESAVELLATHARIEVQFLDGLLGLHEPMQASHIQHQHVDLERELHAVMSGLHRIDETLGPEADGDRDDARAEGHTFYLALSRFVANYLLHIADEEEYALPALRRNIDDATMAEVLARAEATVSAEEAARTTALVMASINAPERAEMLSLTDDAPVIVTDVMRRASGCD